MAKSRKTLRQKKLADRHSAQTSSPKNSSPSTYTYTPSLTTSKAPPIQAAISSAIYPNIKPELVKTLILTSTIVIAELVLFFVL